MDKILITGGNGFIGSHIVERFCREGFDVVCLVRQGSDLSNITGMGVEFRFGDVSDYRSVERNLDGVDFVIHNAARACDWGSYDDFYNVNVAGTLNVLKACSDRGIRDIIITGSNSVYGEENSDTVKDEDSPLNSDYPYFLNRIMPCRMNHYRNTKKLARVEAIRHARVHGQNLTIIDPVFVYGERELHGGFFDYLKSAKDGMPFLPGSKRNKFHVIYAGDLADAYMLAYRKRPQGVNVYLVGNPEAQNMHEIYATYCAQAGLKKPRNLPKPGIYPFALAMEIVWTLARARSAPLLTRGRVNMFYDNIEYSVQKSARELGFTAGTTLAEGMARSAQWYKERGLL